MNREEMDKNLQGVVADLTRLRDEARVRLNLLGKEVKDRWLELDRQVEQVLRLGRRASQATLKRARDLRERLREELARERDSAAPPPSAE